MLKTKEGQFIKEEVESHPVVIFSKTTCSFSGIAKSVFNEMHVSYTLEELDKRENCSAMQDALEKITGARTVRKLQRPCNVLCLI